MSLILIIGESGTGKSTSIRNLDPNETFLLQVLNKPLPFKDSKNKYIPVTKEQEGNTFCSDNWSQILTVIKKINENEKIKTLIIDDFQYVMANEFIRRVAEKGYDKFSEIASHAWQIIDAGVHCRNDLNVFFLAHSQTDEYGKSKCKTIGKLLDEKICLEGMFTIVLHSKIVDDKYYFQTQTDHSSTAKSPMEMFEDKYIQNDLQFVVDKIEEYYNQDIDM